MTTITITKRICQKCQHSYFTDSDSDLCERCSLSNIQNRLISLNKLVDKLTTVLTEKDNEILKLKRQLAFRENIDEGSHDDNFNNNNNNDEQDNNDNEDESPNDNRQVKRRRLNTDKEVNDNEVIQEIKSEGRTYIRTAEGEKLRRLLKDQLGLGFAVSWKRDNIMVRKHFGRGSKEIPLGSYNLNLGLDNIKELIRNRAQTENVDLPSLF